MSHYTKGHSLSITTQQGVFLQPPACTLQPISTERITSDTALLEQAEARKRFLTLRNPRILIMTCGNERQYTAEHWSPHRHGHVTHQARQLNSRNCVSRKGKGRHRETVRPQREEDEAKLSLVGQMTRDEWVLKGTVQDIHLPIPLASAEPQNAKT